MGRGHKIISHYKTETDQGVCYMGRGHKIISHYKTDRSGSVLYGKGAQNNINMHKKHDFLTYKYPSIPIL